MIFYTTLHAHTQLSLVQVPRWVLSRVPVGCWTAQTWSTVLSRVPIGQHRRARHHRGTRESTSSHRGTREAFACVASVVAVLGYRWPRTGTLIKLSYTCTLVPQESRFDALNRMCELL